MSTSQQGPPLSGESGSAMARQPPPCYCLIKIVQRWPYKKLHPVDHQPIGAYFDAAPFFSRKWDVFHVRSNTGGDFFLVPFTQVKEYFELVEQETGITIPSKGKGIIFDFKDCESDRPLFLGYSNTREDYDQLIKTISPRGGSRPTLVELQRSRDQQKESRKAKAAEKRTRKFQNWEKQLLDAAEWLHPQGNKHFVCVDIESYERNHNIITEVGISVLNLAGGCEQDYEANIGTRHIRISEYQHYRNGAFVADNSGQFNFGQTQFVSIKNITKEIAEAFKTQDSKSVVLIGHDTKTDIDYLKAVGYNVNNLNNLTVVDTVDLWRGLSKDPNSIGLGKLCGELDIDAFHLHNAGNDAHYTMCAFLRMVKLASQKARLDDSEIRNE